jgi:hypothetical protein
VPTTLIRHLPVLAATCSGALADQAPISIDGGLLDWQGIGPAYTDPAGDGGASGIDLRRIWFADDPGFFFVRLEVTAEIDLSEDNALRLYLDTDGNAGTGLAINGIGAELEWRFGERVGFFRAGGQTTTVDHSDIRFRAGPTVTGTEFEMALGRAAVPDGVHPLFPGALVRVVVRDVNGDQLPANGQLLSAVLDMGSLPPEAALPLSRECPGDLRLVTYNVQNDGLWNAAKAPAFQRQLVAVGPDVLCLQEIFGHSTEETRSLVASWLGGGPWFGAGNTDCKTVSRFPILGTWSIDGNLACLLDTGAALGRLLLVVNAHLPCCADDAGRQEEIDAILQFLRGATQPGGMVPADTALAIMGDLNLVGLAQQLVSLLSGDVVDEAGFGPDFAPDWDGSDLALLLSRQTELRMGYTWRNDSSSFWPGHLDFCIWSDSVAAVARHFVLYTPEMSPANLALYGLQSGDSLASDHLLHCADLQPPAVPGDANGDGVVNVADLVAVIVSWGPCAAPCGPDLDGSGTVDVADLVLVALNWT